MADSSWIKKLLLPLLWLGWLLLLLLLALVLRAEQSYGANWQLFASFKEAWLTASPAQLKHLISNVAAFVPLGLLAAANYKRGKKRFYWVVPLTLPFIIELTQLLTRRGFCDVDDILNNLLGLAAGAALFQLGAIITGMGKYNDKTGTV